MTIPVSIFLPAAEIGEMPLEDRMEGVFSPRYVSTNLFVLYGALRYSHIMK